MLTRKQAIVTKSTAMEEFSRRTISYKCCTILNSYPEIKIKTNVNTHMCFVSSFSLKQGVIKLTVNVLRKILFCTVQLSLRKQHFYKQGEAHNSMYTSNCIRLLLVFTVYMVLTVLKLL
jgi:hypothetical protein